MRYGWFIALAVSLAAWPALGRAQNAPAARPTPATAPATRPATRPATATAPSSSTTPPTQLDTAPIVRQISESALSAQGTTGTGFTSAGVRLTPGGSPGSATDSTFIPMSSLELGPAPDGPGIPPATSSTAPHTSGVATTQTSTEAGSATTPAQPTFTDPVLQKAATQFSVGQYHDCVDTLAGVVESGHCSVAARHLYIAGLVATNKLSTAGFEAVQGAKAEPKTFLTDKSVAAVLTANPDLPKHLRIVRESGETSTTLERGLLWALYQHLGLGNDSEASVTVTLLNVPPGDRTWYVPLQASLKSTSPK